jgi:hypothetical protein
MSMYGNAAPMTGDNVMEIGAHLMAAFPQTVTKPWLMELARVANKERIPADRIRDAVDWLIQNHRFPTLTIADVLSYDIRVKVYSYHDVLRREGCFNETTAQTYQPYSRYNGNKCLFVNMAEVAELPEGFRSKVEEKIEEFKKKRTAETSKSAPAAPSATASMSDGKEVAK